MQDIKDVFAQLEEGGKINRTHLGLALRACGCIISEEEVKQHVERTEQWVDWNAFVNLVKSHENPSEAELLDAFRMLDEKNEGRVHEKQLKDVLMGEGERLS